MSSFNKQKKKSNLRLISTVENEGEGKMSLKDKTVRGNRKDLQKPTENRFA